MQVSQATGFVATDPTHGLTKVSLPWKTALLAFVVTGFVCFKVTVLGSSPDQPNILLTFSLIVCAALAVARYPGTTLRTLLCFYLMLEILAVVGLVGYSTVSYATLIITVLLARILSRHYDSSASFPGTRLQLCLCAVIVLQFLRSVSMRDALPTLCDALAFALVLWKFPRIPRSDIHLIVNAFIIGTCATASAFLLTSSLSEYRLGDVIFNPNELGNVVGAALLLLISGLFIGPRRPMFWGCAPLLGGVLLLTGSRSSIYACFIGIVLFLFLRRRQFTAISLLLLALVLLRVASVNQFGADGSSVAERLASPVSQSFDESSAQRAKIWGFLLGQVSAYWKWGVGLTNMPLIADAAGIESLATTNGLSVGYQSHNVYLTVLLELGILGLALLVAWQMKVIWWGFRKSLDSPLLVPMMLYLIIQGFFQGMNLKFFSALLLVVCYRTQCAPVEYTNRI